MHSLIVDCRGSADMQTGTRAFEYNLLNQVDFNLKYAGKPLKITEKQGLNTRSCDYK